MAFINNVFSYQTIAPMQSSHLMHPTAERLYAIAKQFGDEQTAQIARRLNLSVQTVHNWESRGVSRDGALLAQAAYGCDANDILGLPGKPRSDVEVREDRGSYVAPLRTSEGYVYFQVMGEAGAGPGMPNTDYPETIREIEIAEWQLLQELGRLPSPARVKLLTVRGDSMTPRIKNGDVVFVDIDDKQPADGGLFVVALHGYTLVKRIEIRIDGLHLVSLARPERPDVIPPNQMENVHIIGRVLGAIQLRNTEVLQSNVAPT